MPHDEGTGQDDRERRLAALRNIAAQTDQNNAPTERMPAAGSPGASPLRPARRRRWALIALAVVVVVVAAGGVWIFQRERTPTTPSAVTMPAVRTVDLSKDHAYCPTQPLWSPDGTRIAMFTTAQDCTLGDGGALNTEITIIDARSGKLVMTIPLSTALAAQGIGSAFFTPQLAWSPDSKSLVFAVNFSGFIVPNAKLPHGLAIISVPGGKVTYYPDTQPIPRLSMASTLIFDTQTGKLVQDISELPYASAYRWGADGSLTPDPTGDITFWQPGDITPVYNDPPAGPRAFYYVSSVTLWSPDGHYVALPAILGARLPGGEDPRSTLATGGTCPYQLEVACRGTATVAAPNLGFAAALTAAVAGTVIPDQSLTIWNPMDVAPRADGKELAVMLPGQGFDVSASKVTVTLFDTATGARTRALSVKRVNTNESGSGQTPAMAWSPRGSSLALVNFGDSNITIWRAA